ncbi:MAG TPA: hypothetical protein VNJ70_06075 [Thermoanaerobaculia bacterium]|nr:hypothetical protein [Thermoanaerobaculia bacterium]
MIRKSDWAAAYQEHLASARQAFGDPPTTAVLVAYTQGQLPAEEALRVQEYLALHPELARALAEPVPESYQAEPGAPDFLSRGEIQQDWAALQARLGGPGEQLADAGPSSRPRRAWHARNGLARAAALLAVLLGGLYVQSQREVSRLAQELREPRANFEQRLLLPDGGRGAAEPPISLPAAADHFLLKPALLGHPDFADYRLKIIDTSGGKSRVVWDRKGLRRLSDDTFELWMPRDFLSSEEYRLELYGIDERGAETPLAHYTLRLPPE